MIAALYVMPGGPYYGLPDVEPWGLPERDARLYAGPWPVVAHPPCQLWVNFAALNFKRYGGEHNRPGNDGGCFASALAAVRRWGGVLEHPAGSNAWAHYGLSRPSRDGGWSETGTLIAGWVCEVWQSAYGHRARKRTWLYAVSDSRPQELDWRHLPGSAQVGWFDRIKPSLSKREASMTPPAFRDLLLSIARSARSTGSSDGGNPAGHRDAAGLSGGGIEGNDTRDKSSRLSESVPAGVHPRRRPEFADPGERVRGEGRRG